MKLDLYQMAIDSEMTQEEYIIELGRQYATYLSMVLEQNPGCAFEYKVHFIDHDVVIGAHRINTCRKTIII